MEKHKLRPDTKEFALVISFNNFPANLFWFVYSVINNLFEYIHIVDKAVDYGSS